MEIFTTTQIKAAFTKYFTKCLITGSIYHVAQNGVLLQSMLLYLPSMARAIQEDLIHLRYRFQAVQPVVIKTPNKDRTVYPLSVTDLIVQNCMRNALAGQLSKKLSPHVYSYVPDKSNHHAAYAFSHYLKQHIHQEMYVLRTDVSNYTDTIPLDKDSTLWPDLQALVDALHFDDVDQKAYFFQLCRDGLIPNIIDSSGKQYQLFSGLPMGTPLCTLVANLYLNRLDHKLTAIDGLFYARFGDDILMAHTDPKQLIYAEKIYDTMLETLRLSRQAEKDLRLYFTRGGIPSPEHMWQTASKIEYVGYCIRRAGAVGLTQARLSTIWRCLKLRINNTQRLMYHFPLNDRLHQLCHVVNQAILPTSTTMEVRCKALLKEINDRAQLKQLDYQIALYIVQKATGLKTVKAFRKISYRQLRQEYGLASLVCLRNQN